MDLKAKQVVFSGGGFKGFAYVGALQALRSKGIDWGAKVPRLSRVAGCSVGALFAAAIAIGYSVPEIEDFLFRVDLRSVVCLQFSPGSLSLDSGQGLKTLVQDFLHRKAKLFATLQDVPELQIAVTDLEAKELCILQASTHPQVSILDALMASMALPPIYPPVLIQGKLYADGGLINYFPVLQTIDTKEPFFAFRVLGKSSSTLKTDLETASFPMASYLKHVYDIATAPFLESCWQALPAEVQAKTFTIVTPDVHLVEFGLGGGEDPRHQMIKAGKSQVQEKLENK